MRVQQIGPRRLGYAAALPGFAPDIVNIEVVTPTEMSDDAISGSEYISW